jgi:hypothetical protein
MRPRFEALKTSRVQFDGEWSDRRRTWLRPEVAISIQALPRREGQTLRHTTLLEVLS